MPNKARESLSEKLAPVIRAELARRNASQKALALHLSLSQPGISDRLRGHTPWDINELASASEFLGIGIRDLLEEAGA